MNDVKSITVHLHLCTELTAQSLNTAEEESDPFAP
jgi:hypothetical protein